jgi:hypothetical protein
VPGFRRRAAGAGALGDLRDLRVFADASFDVMALDERGELVVRHRLPFSSLDLPDAERQGSYRTGPIEYSHSLAGQVGGQLAAGFTLTHLDEAPHHADATARYLPGYLATQAIKP